MPWYTFTCECGLEEDKQYSFAGFDKLKSGELIDLCSACQKPTQRQMGGVNVFVYDATPRTLGSLADKNSSRRLKEVEIDEQKKREKLKAEGKYVPPEKIETWWEAPEKPKVDMKLRKEMKEEYVAKFKPQKRAARNSNKPTNNNKRNEK